MKDRSIPPPYAGSNIAESSSYGQGSPAVVPSADRPDDALAPAKLVLELLVPIVFVAMVVLLSVAHARYLAVISHALGYALLGRVAASVERRRPSFAWRMGGARLGLAAILALVFLCWVPAGLMLATFLVLGWAALLRGAHRRFVVLLAVAVVVAVISGCPPGKPRTWTILGSSLVSIGACFAVYFARTATESTKPRTRRMPLVAAALLFLEPALLFYGEGAATPWATAWVLRQPGCRLLLDPIIGARGIARVRDGHMIQTNGGRAWIARDGVVRECRFFRAHSARGDQPVCDPDDQTTCYAPTLDGELLVVDTVDCSTHTIPVKPFAYDLLTADSQRRHLALVSGRDRVVTVLNRIAPGGFEHVVDLELDALTGIANNSARSLDFTDDALLLVARTADRGLRVWSYTLATGSTREILSTPPAMTGRGGSWSGLTIPGERIVDTTVLGLVQIFDWSGRLVHERRLTPFLRQVSYDATRRLAYLLDDLGFLWILDPASGALRQRLFVGLKPKNLTLDAGAIYVVSSAGIFRIDVDAALAPASG